METSLSRIQSLRLAAVLEDCSDQLDLLDYSLTVQMSRKQSTAAVTCSQERARLTKLRRDCQYTSHQVLKLRSELEEKKSFSSMMDVVEKEEEKKKAADMERQAKRELQLRKQMLQRQQETFQQKNEELKVLRQLAKDLKHQLNEQSAKTAHMKKTSEKDMELQLTQKESSQPEKLLKDQQEKQRKEEVRVHEESQKFLQNQHEELQRQLLQWQQNTNQMLQEKVQQLNSVCCKRTVNADKLLEMWRKFRVMEQVVMEDREEKEKLRKQQDEARAATKLQAWWRGCMVRRGLGMYKKTDESKKGKKKKEGKKKKKK